MRGINNCLATGSVQARLLKEAEAEKVVLTEYYNGMDAIFSAIEQNPIFASNSFWAVTQPILNDTLTALDKDLITLYLKIIENVLKRGSLEAKTNIIQHCSVTDVDTTDGNGNINEETANLLLHQGSTSKYREHRDLVFKVLALLVT